MASSSRITSPRHTSASSSIVSRHSRFYSEDDTAIFRVKDSTTGGDVYFKVHRYFLERDSEVFRDMFSCPTALHRPEGQSEDTAIYLPGVTVYEMECLLAFFYDGMYERVVELQEWVALLSISSRFVFDRIRERAIEVIAKHAPPLDPVERLGLAIKFDIPEWMKPAYVDLCVRPEPLTQEEAEKLGLSTVVRLGRAREQLLRKRMQGILTATAVPISTASGCSCKTCRQQQRRVDEEAKEKDLAVEIIEGSSLSL